MAVFGCVGVILLIFISIGFAIFFLDRDHPIASKPNPIASSVANSSNPGTSPTPRQTPSAKVVVANNGHVIDFDNGVKLKMVRVPKGTAYLGGGDGKPGTNQGEVAEFYMGETEVTQAQWKAVMGADNNPSQFKGDDLPVENVSWNDAKKFIDELNQKKKVSGYLYRLPTEVEWEYACRGGPISEDESKFDYYFDKPTNDLSAPKANFPQMPILTGNTPQETVPKGSRQPRRSRWDRTNRTDLVSMICTVMSGNGVKIVIRRTARTGCCGAAAGLTSAPAVRQRTGTGLRGTQATASVSDLPPVRPHSPRHQKPHRPHRTV